MLSFKQGGIKNYFLSLWYDSTWFWTQVFRDIGKRSNHYAKGINPTILPQAISKISQTKIFDLDMTVDSGEWKIWIQTKAGEGWALFW